MSSIRSRSQCNVNKVLVVVFIGFDVGISGRLNGRDRVLEHRLNDRVMRQNDVLLERFDFSLQLDSIR